MLNDTKVWASNIFGTANLGDARRTKRLVKLTYDLASSIGDSVVKASQDPTSSEGAYRFIRNDNICAQDIAKAGFAYTDNKVKKTRLVLAVQDSTGLSYKHSVRDKLGKVSSANTNKTIKARSLFVHSTVMIDADSELMLGLANQHYWTRDEKVTGTKNEQRDRDKTKKESYKWERNIAQITERLGNSSNVIDICDREADMYEYLEYQVEQGNRFIVRVKENRRLTQAPKKLSDELARSAICGEKDIYIPQRGNRKARWAKLALSYAEVELKKPEKSKGSKSLALKVIQCQEVNTTGEEEKLCWRLYTTEAISSVKDVKKLVRYYELRWRVEEFHKVWKSDGTEVESLRLQSPENIERLAVIMAFIAVRIYQMREVLQNNEKSKELPCTEYMSDLSWKILWKSTTQNKELPIEVPSIYWAYYAIAKLGRWQDSKRTGRVGMKAFWRGWMELMKLVESYEMFKGLELG